MAFVCLAGPTAVGKSSVAIELAKQLEAEILSADSMQIYRQMDIGTGKVTPEEMQGVVHYGIDLVDPNESFSVADFVNYAKKTIANIAQRRRLPLVVGGTTLYLRGLLDGLSFQTVPSSPSLRQNWEDYAANHGREALYQELYKVDPLTAARLHVNDVRRVVRALEVYQLTGRPMSQSYQWQPHRDRSDVLLLVLNGARDWLYARIDKRVDEMMASGWLDEVRRLLAAGVSEDAQSMQAIGYRELVRTLRAEISLEEAVVLIKRNTRRLAKRQISFLRQDPRAIWIEMDDYAQDKVVVQARKKIEQFLAGITLPQREYADE
ncbi:tRNA (adenosine(37)-N6)-dimethylallyltransferase MiaA [Alicyclobacillus tolerans]|uniref:tRNA (adenosine(37)-N6)-dimethylallyltransferase MiaA n=1 Tax=Alicyclobacillus tolerans TaxID=90970 RepID=UPI0027D8CBA6|nr:tRNA (adenosine(37)-N6)-dimethylallyltransferase MiaA [Alicyclobacillus tengchongensis]